MAHALAISRRLSLCVFTAWRLFSADMAHLDSRVASGNVRLPAVFAAAAHILSTWQSDWSEPWPITYRRSFDRRDRSCGADARRVSHFGQVFLNRQPAARDHGSHSAPRTRGVRPHLVAARNSSDRPVMAWSGSVQPVLPCASERICVRRVMAVD